MSTENSWDEHRLLIMDKLAQHSAELSRINEKVTNVENSFSIGMTELKTKIMIGAAILNIAMGSIVAFIMNKILQ